MPNSVAGRADSAARLGSATPVQNRLSPDYRSDCARSWVSSGFIVDSPRLMERRMILLCLSSYDGVIPDLVTASQSSRSEYGTTVAAPLINRDDMWYWVDYSWRRLEGKAI